MTTQKGLGHSGPIPNDYPERLRTIRAEPEIQPPSPNFIPEPLRTLWAIPNDNPERLRTLRADPHSGSARSVLSRWNEIRDRPGVP